MLHHQIPGPYGQMPFGNASTSAPTLPRNQGQGGQNQMQHVDGSYGGALHNQQQQQQAMQYNGVNAPAPASSMMMPQTGQPQHYPYAFAQPGLASAAVVSPQQLDFPRQSNSPQQGLPTNAIEQNPYAPKQFPMAAPLVQSQAPGNAVPQQQQQLPNMAQHSIPSPQSPQSPASQVREPQRINLLLDINGILLKRLSDLQAQDQGGAITPQQALQLKKEGKPDKMASDEYIQIVKRLQGNLSYLSPGKPKQFPGPAFLSPPPQMPELQPLYEQLKDLFPGWPGIENMRSGVQSSPRTNSMHSMNSTNGTTYGQTLQ